MNIQMFATLYKANPETVNLVAVKHATVQVIAVIAGASNGRHDLLY
jgi:hypothetical protein